jgi:SEC-C motif-containing protein
VRQAETAEELMRSRYAAYAVGATDYVFRTWHPRRRPSDVALEPGLSWLGLSVLGVTDGSPSDDLGTVEFVATFRSPRGPGRLREVSAFERRAGRWFYVDGVVS